MRRSDSVRGSLADGAAEAGAGPLGRRGDVYRGLLRERRAGIIVRGDGRTAPARVEAGQRLRQASPPPTLLPEATGMSVLHRIEASAERARASARQLPRAAGGFTDECAFVVAAVGRCSALGASAWGVRAVGRRHLPSPRGEQCDFIGAMLSEGRARRLWSRTARASARVHGVERRARAAASRESAVPAAHMPGAQEEGPRGFPALAFGRPPGDAGSRRTRSLRVRGRRCLLARPVHLRRTSRR